MLTASQAKVLGAIYMATDCSNEVYDYATLHWKQVMVARSTNGLVSSVDGCVPVDGDGFSRERYTEGVGFRLTNAGYEALTEYDAARWPADRRRFYSAQPITPRTNPKQKGPKRAK